MNDLQHQSRALRQVPGIKMNPDGRFTIDCVKLVKGRRIHIYSSGYLTMEEAMQAMPKLIEAKTAYYSKESSIRMTLGEFIQRYEQYRLMHVRLSSVHFGRSVAKMYLSKWDECPVEDVFTYKNIKEVYDTLMGKAASPEWKNRAFGGIRKMVFAAFTWRLVDSGNYQDAISILENIPENRGAKKEKLIWTKREKEKFLSVIKNPHDHLIFSLFIALGARIGEFAGLTWDCYYPKEGYIEIKQQLAYGDTGKWVLTKDLKTQESYRLCKLSTLVNEALKAYKDTTSGEGFIFTADYDPKEPMSKATFRRKFYHYIEVAGVRRVTPHSIRHRKATDLMRVCRNMEEVKAAARYLGHSATMMIDTYGHSARSATDAVLKRLEKEEE